MSNWENDKDPIGPSSDRLLRMMVALGAQVDEYPLEELTKIANEPKPSHPGSCVTEDESALP